MAGHYHSFLVYTNMMRRGAIMKTFLFPFILFLLLPVACQGKKQSFFDREQSITAMQKMVESSGKIEPLLLFADKITNSREISASILASAYLNRIPPCLMLAIARVESGFVPLALHSNETSYDIGVFQLNNLTFSNYPEESLYVVFTNARLAGDYLRELYKLHGSWELSIMSYNCGGIQKRIPGQTARYMREVLKWESLYLSAFYEEVIHGQD